MTFNVLLVGSGGRESALAWSLAKSPLVSHVYVYPGNGQTASSLSSKVSNVDTTSTASFADLVDIAVKKDVRLVVPGPENIIADGIFDYFRENAPARIAVFSPSTVAAKMESSKAFAKDFMKRHDIPTADYQTFTAYSDAQAWLESNKTKRIVIKASGLAAGKGVIIPQSYEESAAALTSIMLDKDFGTAGDEVVIEEYLDGEEISVLAFSDGYTVQVLPAAQDHKRINDGDQGPNTGGMGCYAPAPIATPELMERIRREVLQKTVDGMRQEKFPFVGCLFVGFMVENGVPKVLEYNVRFGDPETQTLLPLLETDLAEVMLACTSGYLSSINLKSREAFSTTVVVSAPGYPGPYDKGLEMTVNEPNDNDTFIFHAGTSFDENTKKLKTSGGRVIATTAVGSSIKEAVRKAYEGVSSCIHFDRMHYRRDIAHRALNRPAPASISVPAATNGDTTPMTYAQAGVSIDAGDALVQLIKPMVKSTARPGAGAVIGGFGGDITLSEAGYPAGSPRVICCIDGVGTKLIIAQAVGTPAAYLAVGIDLVGMSTNDLVVCGGQPLAFLDYYACSELDVEAAAAFVKGVAEGCKLSDCALVGGETAEMPSLYKKGDFDAAGAAIGALGHGLTMLPDTGSMSEGDVLLGLASDGLHSNGFSMVRAIVKRSGLSYSDPAPWDSGPTQRTVGEALLVPTRIYVRPLLSVLPGPTDVGVTPRIVGMAHMTGGGVENIPRMLPPHLEARISIGSWPVPPVFRWLKRVGKLENKEFARTFNCGVGMVLVVKQEEVEGITRDLEAKGEKVFRIGVLGARGEGGAGYVMEGIEKWDDL